MRRVIRGLNAPAVILLAAAFLSSAGPAAAAPSATHQSEEAPVAIARLPLAFEPNVGQAPDDVVYVSRAARYRLSLADGEARFAAPGAADPAEGIRLRWLGGATAAAVIAGDPLPGKAHYYLAPGVSRENVPMYGSVVYRGVYPGIDLVFHGSQRDAEFDFVIPPGADPRAIRLEVAGADGLALEADDLVARRGETRLRLHKPVVYQEGPAGRIAVEGRFSVSGRRIAFEIGNYDRGRPLVIDPVVTYSTYLGGAAGEGSSGVGADAAGNMYANVGNSIVKLSADGSTLLYSVVLGDSTPRMLTVDAAGNAYVLSTCPYPRSGIQTFCPAGSIDGKSPIPTAQGDSMAIVTKLSPSGQSLFAATMGGNGSVTPTGVALDPAGNIYVTGWGIWRDIHATRPPFAQPGVTTGFPAFVEAIAADWSHYIYAVEFLTGGDGAFRPTGIAVDATGAAYVTGGAGAQFPVTAGAYQTAPGGGSLGSGVVAKIAPDASQLVYSTFLGNGATHPNAIAVDGGGNAYVAGYAGAGLPTAGAIQTAPAGGTDAFVSKLNPSGSALVFSTYLGGSLDDAALAIGLDQAGNVYIAGGTDSTDFPQRNALPPAFGTAGSNFLTALNPAGNDFVYSTYFADTQTLLGAMRVTAGGTVYLSGTTSSTSYPTVNPYQATSGGSADAFIARVEPGASANPCGAGLFLAEYFANISLTPPAARTQCEASINYDWGIGGPAGVPPDNFSARWTGRFNFAGGNVTFTARADDGVRVFLDGTLIIDGWKDQPPTTYTATRNVTAGEHEVKVEYYEKLEGAVIQVGWTGGGGSGCQPGVFLAEYFSNTTLTAPATRTACEGPPNYTWGAGGPAGLPVDNFSARWTGSPTFNAGSYTFTVRADDGVRLFLDGALIIDGWKDQPATTYTATRTLTAGAHEVKIEYYERGGDALIQASWAPSGAPPAPAITTLTPNTATAGGPGFTLTVDGSNFVSGATVFWNGHATTTTFGSGTRLTASILADDVKTAGSIPVFVVNPGGQRSNIVNFSVTPAGTSCPAGQFFAEYFSNIALTAPDTRTACELSVNYDWGAGGPAGLPVDNFSARWTGSFPFANETVTFTVRADDGVRLFLDGTLIIDGWKDQPPTTYTTTRTVTSGNHQIKVEYYERGGGAVIQVAWGGTTSTPAPTLTTLTPNTATAGGPAFTLTADGANFVSGATVLWNGAARTTTFVSATRVTASIPGSDIAAAGSAPVTVRNPDGQTSGAQTFTISPSGGGGGGDTIKVIITAPASGATVKGTVWFTVWLENAAAGSRTVTLSVNGTTITSTTTSSNGPISLPWSTTAADNGSKTATVSVRDSANATGRASITVTVAN